MRRHHVDDVDPFVAALVAVTHQLRSDRVAVGLVADQYTTERVAGARVEGLEERAKVIVSHD
jgi:hypothetical protein